MAASKSKVPTSRQPHEVPLPASPQAAKKRSGKGKGRAHAEQQQSAPEVGPSDQGVPWSWTSVTDAGVGKLPPVFSKDGSYFFSAVGSSVKIYSTSTGAIVSTLSAPPLETGPAGPITSAILNPQNEFQLITGSLDGHIRVWDFVDGVLIRNIQTEHEVYHLAAHPRYKGYVFVAGGRSEKKRKLEKTRGHKDHGVVFKMSLRVTAGTLRRAVQKPSEFISVGKTRATHGLGFSASGSWLVAVGGHKAYVASMSNVKAGFVKFVSPEALTCMAFHPSEEYFATGDAVGNIRLWYCLDETIAVHAAKVEKRAPTTTLHWHAHAVASIAFTPNGAYLLSGGEESVLVIWQLQSGKREFVPRVGSPIVSVAVSRAGEEEYLLGLADATFVFVSAARLKVTRSYSRIKLDPANPNSRPDATKHHIPLAIHSPSSTLILPSSHPSSLQTYSPSASKLIAELEVSPSNRVSRKDEEALEPSRVERAVISSSGDWMATVDVREGDASFHGEVYLKIWQWDKSSGFWILNTRVDRPHGLRRVTGVTFSPSNHDPNATLLVTTGEDGNLKSWRARTVKDRRTGATEVFWVVRSTVTFRQETPHHPSWSPDGSLLAVPFESSVAIYDPVTNALLHMLNTPESRGVIQSVCFVGEGGRYLAAVGLRDVVVWDLITQTALWHRVFETVDAVVPHPFDDSFAVFQPSTVKGAPTQVSIFRATSDRLQSTRSLPFRLRECAWYPGTGDASRSFHLVGITEAWDVVFFGDDVRLRTSPGSSATGLVPGTSSRPRNTLFQDIFGEAALADVSAPPTTDAPPRTWNGKELSDVFDAPAYLMPPLETLFDSLMSSFLQPRAAAAATGSTPGKARPQAAEDDSDDSDEEMDVDDDDGDAPAVSSARVIRHVDGFEMGTFVALFRQHAVKVPSSSVLPSQPSNGTPIINGNHVTSNNKPLAAKTKVNGTPRVEPPASYPSPASSPSSTSPTPSPASAGKKRKKP
ncbi:WD40 repeat-like protein [Auriscalpium vulgare]|uniref:WD40 repeat-like protein n=1 Tax=Auriscalpium vulgare TaxID=40419 RepID=A0ACB8RMQ5_9AGAM|nr:WD40 repeat-like protein [Auriscalpium vulgare]